MALESKRTETLELLLSNRCFSEAIPRLEQIVSAESCDTQEAVHLACAYQIVGDYAAAINLFEQILTEDRLVPTDSAALYERLGYCLLAGKEREKAEGAFDRAISFNNNSPRAVIGLALCRFESGNIGDARRLFERAIEIEPDCADACSNLGVLAWAEASIDEALGFFKRALEIDPTHKDALPNYLSILFALESYDAAESLLECYLDAAPDNPDVAYQLAYCRLKLGREKEARDLLKKILDTDPGQEDALALLAECGTT